MYDMIHNFDQLIHPLIHRPALVGGGCSLPHMQGIWTIIESCHNLKNRLSSTNELIILDNTPSKVPLKIIQPLSLKYLLSHISFIAWLPLTQAPPLHCHRTSFAKWLEFLKVFLRHFPVWSTYRPINVSIWNFYVYPNLASSHVLSLSLKSGLVTACGEWI